MHTAQYNYNTLSTRRLISQASCYYNENKRNIELYKALDLPELEVLATKHLAHWKQTLHDLIFNCDTRLL